MEEHVMVNVKRVNSIKEEVNNECARADLKTYALPSSDRSRQINALIRERYSVDDEIALLRKVHIGKATEEEFKEYSDFVDECIQAIDNQMNID